MLPSAEDLRAAASRSAALAAAWRAGPARRHADAVLDPLAGARAEAVADAAAGLLADDGWLAELLAPLVAAQRGDAWLEPPLRGHRDPLRCGGILFEHALVAFTATVLSARVLATLPPPATVVVPGRLSVVRYVRAGNVRLSRWRVPPLPRPFSTATMGTSAFAGARRLRDGELVRHDGRVTGMLLSDAAGDVVTVTATVRIDGAAVMREYDRATGAFVRMATTDEGAARSQLLLTLLRELDAPGAAPYFEAATRDGAFFLRWAAMREWLAHDWRAAQPRLRAMAAGDPHPEVRAAAAATLAQLAERLAA